MAREEIRKINTRHESSLVLANERFAVFDNRLHFVKEMPAQRIPGTIKEYLVNGKSFFDQLVLSAASGKTNVFINRYTAAETATNSSRLVDSFPFSAPGTRFLLVRSEDLSKILLIGFEFRPGQLPRLHTVLFDGGWNILYHQVLEHAYFTQPCIQDDFVSFPAENFDNLPVKLANNGEWLMASASIASLNYLLFHIYDDGKSFYYQEIPLSPYYTMEDIAMSIDNEHLDMSVGLLSRYRNTSVKNVQVSHYSMIQNRFDFDSSYQFNSLAGRLRNQNLSNESFISVPGEGYMLFKEYGRPKDSQDLFPPDIEPWDPVYLMATSSGSENDKSQLNQNGYTLKKGLQGIRSLFNRGNLTMFYFPLRAQDSTWSGIINTEQTTELNAPYLSYLVFPVKNRVYIIYNSEIRSADEFGTATTLNTNGQPTDDPVIFWKMDRTLDFQKARRISAEEVAVPYKNNLQTGFAVIRLVPVNGPPSTVN
ncbi:MAG: hypothetical protein Q8939_08520 [Bacteroidota bacterium]|nr:hypothetical protein [Bacteroidota bacterium]